MYGKKKSGIGITPLVSDEGLLYNQPVGNAKYKDTLEGNTFSLVFAAWTTAIAAGHLLAAAAAANVQFILWNPIGSTVNLSLQRFDLNVTSGTTPVSGIWHAVGSTAPTIASGTLASGAYINSHLASTPAYNGKAGYYTHVSGGAATGAAAARIVRATGFSMSAGTYASLAGVTFTDRIDGDIVLPPNSFWVPQWAAAGTTMLGGYSITWKEVAI